MSCLLGLVDICLCTRLKCVCDLLDRLENIRLLFVVTLCFKPVDCVIVMDRTCPGGCSRVSCESALAFVVLSVLLDWLETIR